jgi:Ni/Co efflux regulator RcnB
MKKILIVAAMFSAFAAAPASAAMMACTADNMAKTTTMMTTMADGPSKMGMGKEMGMANTEMSKGNMRGGCMHYMNAQKMSMMKQDTGMMNMGMK